MPNPVADILKVPELRRRILFTLGIVAAYRVGASIPVPGVNADALASFFAAQANTLLVAGNVSGGYSAPRRDMIRPGTETADRESRKPPSAAREWNRTRDERHRDVARSLFFSL